MSRLRSCRKRLTLPQLPCLGFVTFAAEITRFSGRAARLGNLSGFRCCLTKLTPAWHRHLSQRSVNTCLDVFTVMSRVPEFV